MSKEKFDPLKDVLFIFDEIRRFSRINIRQLSEQDRFELLYTIPAPRGGHFACGKAASRRLRHIARHYLATSSHSSRIDIGDFANEIAKTLSLRFMGEQRPIDQSQVARALASAFKTATEFCKDAIHYFPCQIVSDETPDLLNLGPIVFRPRRLFRNEISADLEEYVSDVKADRELKYPKLKEYAGLDSLAISEKAEEFARVFTTGIDDYFSQYGWVACIPITGCDTKTSKKRAEFIAEAGLNVLRVMLGEHYSDRFRLGGSQVSPSKKAHLHRDDLGKLDISLASDSVSQHLGKDWWTILNRNITKERLEMAGDALAAIAAGRSDCPLCERLLDAFSWFGQAVTDEHAGSRITKYVTSIERMILCEEKNDITSIIEIRVAALCHKSDKDDFREWQNEAALIYKARSNLVHGSISPHDPTLEPLAHRAAHVARFTLINGLDFFSHIGLMSNMSPKILNKHYVRLTEHVLKQVGTDNQL